jgi:hypothetical protein
MVWIYIVYAALPILVSVTNLGGTLAWGITIGLMVVFLAGSAMACIKVAASEDMPEYAAPYDTARVTRIVQEKTANEIVEHLASGAPGTTFREALEHRWPFESIDKDEEWIIQDSKSNDVTDRPLVDCNDIAAIIVFSRTPDTSEEANHLPEWWDT